MAAYAGLLKLAGDKMVPRGVHAELRPLMALPCIYPDHLQMIEESVREQAPVAQEVAVRLPWCRCVAAQLAL